MSKVVVFGSLNMDLTIECNALPLAGQTVEGRGFFTNPGGKGGNQAVAAAKLGAPTYMIAKVGSDLFGGQLKSTLENYGVSCAHVCESARNSTGVAVITRSAGDNRIVLSPGANHEMREGDVARVLDALSEAGDVFMTQYECNAKTVLASLALARERGLFTLFNPAPAKSIPPESYKNIDLIVVNQTECEFLTGLYPTTREDCQDALTRFSAMGAGGAVITLGEAGSASRVNGELLWVDSYSVPNVDTTAAGDAYIGALAATLALGCGMEECMRFATKVAALTVTKQGAQQSIPTRAEVEEYFA